MRDTVRGSCKRCSIRGATTATTTTTTTTAGGVATTSLRLSVCLWKARTGTKQQEGEEDASIQGISGRSRRSKGME